MTLNERIKFLRKTLGLNQTDFGKKIGIKVSQASFIEKPNNPVTQRIIQLICTAFNVSEEWLTNGTGDMYISNEDAIIEKLSQMYDLTPTQEKFARHWLQLPAEAKDAVVDYILGVANAMQTNQGTKKDVSDSDTPSMDNHARNANPADTGATLPPSTAPADTSRPAGLSDEEWQLVQMSREEKEQASPTSSATSSAMA